MCKVHVQEPGGEEKRRVEEGTEGVPKPPSNSEELPKAPRVWQEMHCCRDRVQSLDLVLRATGSHGEEDSDMAVGFCYRKIPRASVWEVELRRQEGRGHNQVRAAEVGLLVV